MKINPKDYKNNDIIQVDCFEHKDLVVIVAQDQDRKFAPSIFIPNHGSYYLNGDWDDMYKITKLVKQTLINKISRRYFV